MWDSLHLAFRISNFEFDTMHNNLNKLVERFFNYVKINTQSDENTHTTPSTASQGYFAEMLANELEEIGLKDVHISRHSYVTATIPANCDCDAPTIGFIAHMDTSPETSGANVKPQVVKFDGDTLVINNELGVKLDAKEYKELTHYVGEEIITSDGTTLLGADDKAGIAEIVTAAEYLIQHPEIKHGKIRVAFTPDEEIGEGADHFNVEKFGADFAYTEDGGGLGEIEFENFNAAAATVKFTGHNIHPGYALGKMVNASRLISDFLNMLPEDECPEMTDGYKGFFHVTEMKSTVTSGEINLIIRDFDEKSFTDRKEYLQRVVDALNKHYKNGKVELEIRDQYANMKQEIEKVPHVVDRAINAMKTLDITPVVVPIRGGTDGARLSFMGLPCPNLFAGGHNFHSNTEYVPVLSMKAAMDVIIEIAKCK